MIVIEFYKQREDGVNLFRTYSDAGFMIQKMGTSEVYSEAIDVEGAYWDYMEIAEKRSEELSKRPSEAIDANTILKMLEGIF